MGTSFYFIAFGITVADQLLKYLVQKYMLLGQSIPLIGNWVNLTYVHNTGAAFSIFVGFSPYLSMIGVLVVLVVIYFHYELSQHEYFIQTILALILGGSLGNLADRLLRGHVIDFIDFKFWPVFNLADVMINLGVVLLIVYISFPKRRKIYHHHRHPKNHGGGH